MSETPADHYVWAEALIARSADEGDYDRKAHLIAVAQVHATLATVPVFPEKRIEQCTCPRLGASPIARTSTDPACPIHGGT